LSAPPRAGLRPAGWGREIPICKRTPIDLARICGSRDPRRAKRGSAERVRSRFVNVRVTPGMVDGSRVFVAALRLPRLCVSPYG
jgi:hypothetical protein